MFAVPSNDTPFIFLAVANFIAVAAFPVVDPAVPETFPVTLPVTLPVKSPVTSPVTSPTIPVPSTVNPANSADDPETTTFFHSAIIVNFNYCFYFIC